MIAGPTASGKSALALRLAELAGGEIVNADASQVYRDLHVLSARPSRQDEARAPHHLFGHIDGGEAMSAARWAAEARDTIAAIHARGSLPILVGGTGLYLRTLLDGIAPVPEIDPQVRATVRAMPVDEAQAALAREDPAAARRLAPADTARIARALEVVRSTGRPLSEWQAERAGGIGDLVSLRPLILLPPRDLLDARIEARAAAMMNEGAVEEVRAMLARALSDDAPVRRAIGVPEIARLLTGEASLAQTLTALTLSTRRYAKRQGTWFRHQPPPAWTRTAQLCFSKEFLKETFLLSG